MWIINNLSVSLLDGTSFLKTRKDSKISMGPDYLLASLVSNLKLFLPLTCWWGRKEEVSMAYVTVMKFKFKILHKLWPYQEDVHWLNEIQQLILLFHLVLRNMFSTRITIHVIKIESHGDAPCWKTEYFMMKIIPTDREFHADSKNMIFSQRFIRFKSFTLPWDFTFNYLS